MRLPRLLLPLVLVFVAGGCGGGSTTTPTTTPTPTPTPTPNRAPVIAAMTVGPTFGVSGLTTIALTAAASDADADVLSYIWSFSGGAATGASTSAKISGDGAVVVQLVVSDGRGGTASDSRTITIGTMTGNWDFIAGPCGADPRERAVFTFTQTSGTVNGALNFPSNWCQVNPGTHGEIPSSTPGTIDENGNFTLPRIAVGAFLDLRLANGRMDSTGRRVTGQVFNSGFTGETFTLTKR